LPRERGLDVCHMKKIVKTKQRLIPIKWTMMIPGINRNAAINRLHTFVRGSKTPCSIFFAEENCKTKGR
jgi:hypothetical protein